MVKDKLWETRNGWEPLEDMALLGGKRAFSQGEGNADLFRLSYFREGKALVGKVWFGKDSEGPPQHAHGGSIAGVFDEIMGSVAWMNRIPVLAKEIQVFFAKPIPLLTVLEYKAWISQRRGSKVYTRASLFSLTGEVYAQGRGLFIQLKSHHLREVSSEIRDRLRKAGIPLP